METDPHWVLVEPWTRAGTGKGKSVLTSAHLFQEYCLSSEKTIRKMNYWNKYFYLKKLYLNMRGVLQRGRRLSDSFHPFVDVMSQIHWLVYTEPSLHLRSEFSLCYIIFLMDCWFQSMEMRVLHLYQGNWSVVFLFGNVSVYFWSKGNGDYCILWSQNHWNS